jgi:hypothetical protein
MKRKKFAAYTLLEILLVVALMPLAFLLEAHLAMGSFRVINASHGPANPIIAIDAVANILRRDVWNTAEISTPNQSTLVLKQSDGARIDWKFQNNFATRTQAASTQSWNLPMRLQIQQQPTSIALNSDDDNQRWQFPRAIWIAEANK